MGKLRIPVARLWSPRTLLVLGIIGVVSAVVGVVLLVWRGPWWLDGAYLSREGLRSGSAILVTGFRAAVVQLLAFLGAGIALLFTAFNYRLTRRGQVTDRFVKALERLDSEQMYVRIGGILALEQIVEDAPEQATHAAKVLNAFVRQRTPPVRSRASSRGAQVAAARRAARDRRVTATGTPAPPPNAPDADVQQALTLLTLPRFRRHVSADQPLNLSRLHLAGVQLPRADLTYASLLDSELVRSDFARADLSHARLDGARLIDADLNHANLHHASLFNARCDGTALLGANFTEASLLAASFTGTTLLDTDFTRANLVDAHLQGALFLRTNFTEALLHGADLRGEALATSQVLAAATLSGALLPPEVAASSKAMEKVAREREAAARVDDEDSSELMERMLQQGWTRWPPTEEDGQ